MRGFSLFGKCQRGPAVYAEQYDQHGLHSVYYQHEVEGVDVAHTIENEHGLHCKMPRAGPVWRWNNHGYAAHHKRNEGTLKAQRRCEVEAEEREIIVKKIAYPYSQSVKYEQGNVLYAFKNAPENPPSPPSTSGRIVFFTCSFISSTDL